MLIILVANSGLSSYVDNAMEFEKNGTGFESWSGHQLGDAGTGTDYR